MLFSVEFWKLSTGAEICYAPGMRFTKNIIITHSFVFIYQSNLASLQSINVKVYLNKNREKNLIKWLLLQHFVRHQSVQFDWFPVNI